MKIRFGKIKRFGNISLATGILVFLIGLVIVIKTKPNMFFFSDSPVLKERQFAINQARQEGKSTYSFDTNYIPGVGFIGNPDQYKQQRLQDIQNQIDSSK